MPETPSRSSLATPRWRAELLRATGRNALLHYEDSPTGTLDLATAHPSGLAQFLAGRPTRLSDLFRESGALSAARRRARSIRLAAAQLADQHGIGGSYLASGLVGWHPTDGDRLVVAPVLLRPLTLRPVGGQGDDDLDLGRDVRVNPALVRALASEGVHVDAASLSSLATGDYGFSPRPALAALAEVAGHLPGFAMAELTVVGVFVDVVPALLDELDRVSAVLEAHPVAALLASVEAVQSPEPSGNAQPPEPASAAAAVPSPFDVPFALGALDVDQRRVLGALAQGRSVRVTAPAGTGATRLLAQLVAGEAGRGRRMLLVASQRAELRAVLDSLVVMGLGHLVDDPARLIDAPRARRPRPGEGRAGHDDATGSAREALAALASRREALHRPMHPWDVSVLQALHALTRLTAGSGAPTTRVRLDRAATARLAGGRREAAEAQLRKLAELGAFDARNESSAWHGASFGSAEAARRAVDTARRIASGQLPAVQEHMARVATSAGLAPATAVVDWGRQIELLTAVRSTLEIFTPKVYERPVGEMIAATGTAEWRDEHGVRMSPLDRRRWRRQARELLRPGAQAGDLHDALVRAQAERVQWQQMSAGGGWPQVPPGLAPADSAYRQLVADLRSLEAPLATTADGSDLLTAPLDALAARLARLAVQDDVTATLPDRVATSIPLRDDGLGDLLTDLAARRVPADRVGDELQLCWWASVLRQALADSPVVASGDDAAPAFTHAQSWHWELARASLRSLSDDDKGMRGRCTVVSPLALPQVLAPDEDFDLVVVAGAHLCGVPEGVLAIARGRQTLVIGDPGGLPSSGLDVDAAAAAGTGQAAGQGGERFDVPVRRSLLEGTRRVLPTLELTHQHRMPAQIARLAAVPSAWAVPVPRSPFALEVVSGGAATPGRDGTVESVDAEVRRVVRLVVAHARSGSEQSLAVIAVTRSHARRIADAVRAELADDRDVARYFARRSAQGSGESGRAGAEPFVVTDLARCEDAVRDVVLLSVGYGQTPQGTVVHRFGPLDEDGGERALAVAVTRARRLVTVVSCFTADELEPDRLRTPGARLLRRVLQEACADNGLWPADPAPIDPAPVADPLVDDLCRRLVGRGLEATAPGGGPGWPDLVVRTPGDRPVAVLTDGRWDVGAAAGDARELVLDDLSVAEHLDRFGWRVVRLSSLELFTDPGASAARIATAGAGAP
ncbi:MAG: DUF4011 domain-containing protein [Actinomycetes bacterium]